MSDVGEQPTALALAIQGEGEVSPTHFAAPAVFAHRYEVRALLGEGGMGSVFRVQDLELGEEIALKVLSRALAKDAAAVDRFRREVKLARRVTHPNVARTYDVGHHEDVRFLTMELVDGAPLASSVRGGMCTPLAETLRVAEQVARGLSAAHAVGVVHRDLKPENVMCGRGTNGRIVITDFGIARLAEGARDDAQLTQNQIVGTPGYMAPEQLMGKAIDGRTDVYAFGTLLFEMLTGVLPFRRDTILAAAFARLSEDAPDVRDVDPTIPELVAQTIAKALARRREDRPDAESMLQTIERLRGAGERHDRAPKVTTGPLASGGLSTTGMRCVAVAPVDVPPGTSWSGDDLGAALADGFSSLRGLRVLPPSAVRDAGPTADPRAVARDLGATWLVETSLRSAGTRARARVRLHDVESGAQLWAAEPIEGLEGDAFALEDRVVRTATDALRERLGESTGRVMSPRVREIFDRAHALAQRRALPLLAQAVAELEAGLVEIPGDPALSCLLGATLVRIYGITGCRDTALAARAEELSLRALAADPSLGEAYLAIGLLRMEQGELRAAVRALREALDRSPRSADSHSAIGLLLAECGNTEEALWRFDAAIRLDPQSLTARLERARMRSLLGDRDGAEKDMLAGGPGAANSFLVRAVFWWGDRERAAALAASFEQNATGAAWEMAVPVLRAFVRGEYFEGAPELFARLVAGSTAADRNRCRAVEIASEYFGMMGKHELALEWLEQAESLPFVNVLWIDRCACLDGLRDDPRFARIRACVAARAADLWR